MNLLKKLIRLHKLLFFTAMFVTFLSVILELGWNTVLAEMINRIGNPTPTFLYELIGIAVFIILFHTTSECIASWLASYTCEIFAHEMRMGYGRFYLQSDIRTLSKFNAGEEQSAMQNELTEISAYLNQNLFSLTKQFVSFVVTVVFLFCRNPKLTLFSTLPVIPLIIYCFFSSKIIKDYTEQCQKSKKQMNGLMDTILELFPVIQVYRAYRLMHSAMSERLLEWQTSNIKKERVAAGLMSLSGLLSFVPLLLLLGFGGFMVIKDEISVGVFYIFINLSGNVSGFLQNMPNIYAGFRRFGASVDGLEKKLVLREEI